VPAEKLWKEVKDEASGSQKSQWASKRQQRDDCRARLPSPSWRGPPRFGLVTLVGAAILLDWAKPISSWCSELFVRVRVRVIDEEELASLRASVHRGRPFGQPEWQKQIAKR
jgi:hypothetical protein